MAIPETIGVTPDGVTTLYAALISGAVAITVAVITRMRPALMNGGNGEAQTAIPVKPTPELANIVDRLEDGVERAEAALSNLNRTVYTVEGRISALDTAVRTIPQLGERIAVVESALRDIKAAVVDIQTEAHLTKHAMRNIQMRNEAVDHLAAKDREIREGD